MKTTTLLSTLALACLASSAFAQSAATDAPRDIRQQQRIEHGLQSGALTTREAARLEREQAAVDHAQAHALKDGTVTEGESKRIAQMQNHASRSIYAEKHDAQTGNPNSASSKRMQTDVKRDIHQEKRIRQGLASGSLTNREAAHLERGQAHAERVQFRAGRDGHVGAGEQRHARRIEQRQSKHIARQKHDRQHRA